MPSGGAGFRFGNDFLVGGIAQLLQKLLARQAVPGHLPDGPVDQPPVLPGRHALGRERERRAASAVGERHGAQGLLRCSPADFQVKHHRALQRDGVKAIVAQGREVMPALRTIPRELPFHLGYQNINDLTFGHNLVRGLFPIASLSTSHHRPAGGIWQVGAGHVGVCSSPSSPLPSPLLRKERRGWPQDGSTSSPRPSSSILNGGEGGRRPGEERSGYGDGLEIIRAGSGGTKRWF